jgi:hypothetical protein
VNEAANPSSTKNAAGGGELPAAKVLRRVRL